MSEDVALPTPRLQVVGLSAGYGPVPVLFDVSLTVGQGEIVALLGPNGAGKTTTLRAIAGVVPPASGSVLLDGQPLGLCRPVGAARLGIRYIPEGGGLLRGLTVTENLLLAGWSSTRRRHDLTRRLEQVWERFPVLTGRRHQSASTLSGGERQMLALAQAIMTDARLLLVDEATLGLAPVMVAALFDVLSGLRAHGHSIVLVEQNARLIREVADRACVLEKGRVVDAGEANSVAEHGRLADAYFGFGDSRVMARPQPTGTVCPT
jgi:branched-chain amino acid transport system ATP-binding protein